MTLNIKNLNLPEIENINFKLESNGLFGLIGKNGIGKSTFFDVLSGDILIKNAEIEVGEIAYIPDINSLDGNLKMDDYINLLTSDEQQEALRLQKDFKTEVYADKKIGKFSLGMKQLFATVLLFSKQSDLMIIDELFSGLDISIKQKVYSELKKLAKSKIILVTSHQLQEIELLCETTYLLSERGLSRVTDFHEAAKEIGYVDNSFNFYDSSINS